MTTTLKLEERRRRVIELRGQGLSLRAIGRQLGISHELVRRDALASELTVTPPKLGGRGQSFWEHVQREFELDELETELLTQVCRLLDRADALQADIAEHGVVLVSARGDRRPNPAVAEERQVSLALGRLVVQLGLPDDDGEQPASLTTIRARRAARARWGGGHRGA